MVSRLVALVGPSISIGLYGSFSSLLTMEGYKSHRRPAVGAGLAGNSPGLLGLLGQVVLFLRLLLPLQNGGTFL